MEFTNLKALKEYVYIGTEESIIQEIELFLKSSCLIDVHCIVSSADMYAAYKEWCVDNNLHAVTHKRFSTLLLKYGVTKKHKNTGNYWMCLSLKTDPRSVVPSCVIHYRADVPPQRG